MRVNFKKILLKHTYLCDLSFFTLFFSLLYGFFLGSFPLEVPDSARYAEIPREMVFRGDYLVPYLNGVKYFEKPPLFYWLQSLAIKCFGLSEWSLHIMNALMAFLTCLVIYFAARKLYDRLTALFSSLVLSSTALFFVMARIITLDMALTFFLTTSLLCFIFANEVTNNTRRFFCFLGMYVFAALATMTKGLVGFIFPGLVIFVWVAFFNKWRDLKRYHLIIGSIVFLLITLPWHILVQMKHPEFFHFYFLEQHFLRYFTSYAGRAQPFWFFPVVFVAGFFPWIFFLLGALKKTWFKLDERETKQRYLFFVFWALVIFGFYLFSDSKLVPYILPVFPPLALLLGRFLALFYEGKKDIDPTLAIRGYCFVALLLAVVAVLAVFFINFEIMAITRAHLYLIASSLLFGAIITYVFLRKYGAKKAILVLMMANIIFLLSLTPSINIVNKKSIKPLIMVLKTKMQMGDEVVSYGDYYQDLPYYLRSKVTVVDYKGELSFGVLHGDASQWMIDSETFRQRWQSGKRMFLLVSKKNYSRVKELTESKNLYPLGSYLHVLLLTNKKMLP